MSQMELNFVDRKCGVCDSEFDPQNKDLDTVFVFVDGREMCESCMKKQFKKDENVSWAVELGDNGLFLFFEWGDSVESKNRKWLELVGSWE